jgi:hypothetical protein
VPWHCLQTALDVPEGDVEVWIVRAIGKKLLDARIDQLGEASDGSGG